MDEKMCIEKHKRVDEKFDTHEKRLNNHAERIDKLEQNGGKLEERIDNLIKQLSSLTAVMKWFIGLLVGSFVAFFFYAVQQGLFK